MLVTNPQQDMSATGKSFPEFRGLRNVAPLTLVGGLLVHGLVIAVWQRGFFPLIDVAIYRAGGMAVVNGISLYTAPLVEGFWFTYTPFAGLVFVPLAFIPLAVVKIFAIVVNLCCTTLAAWMCWRQLGYRADVTLGRIAVFSAGLLVWLEPVWTTVDLGQINLVLLVLILADIRRNDESRYKGMGVGIAAGVKLTPALFILYLFITRRFRAAAVAVATFIGTVGIGLFALPGDTATYWSGAFFNAKRVGAVEVSSDQSLNGMLARLVETSAPSTWAWLLIAIPVGSIGMAVAALAHRQGRELLAAALCGMTATAVSPFSWSHHWVWFIPLTICIADLALSERSNRQFLLLAAVYLLAFNWLVRFPTPDSRLPPAAGLFFLNTWPWIEYVSRNVYILIYAVVLMVSVELMYGRSRQVSSRRLNSSVDN